MAIIMQKITKRLIQKMLKDFESVAESMAKSGSDKQDIIRAFNNHINIKSQQYYKNDRMQNIREAISLTMENLKVKTSKAEFIFRNMLISSDIPFSYQYKIGPYSADFLIDGFLIVEIDGPDHEPIRDEFRDKYMGKMGYKIMRVPLTVLFHSPETIIEEIKCQMAQGK